MKKIALSVYENLSSNQRVIACIEALARGDEKEMDILLSSCPKLIYSQPDAQFLEVMENLMGLAMAVEADLKEFLLRYFVSIRCEIGTSCKHLQDFADCREAWNMTLDVMGIDKRAMALAGPPTSPVFEFFEILFPEPDGKKTEELSAHMLKFIRKSASSF